MLSDADFAFIARELKARTGAVLTPDANAACEHRLAPLARREGYGAVSEFLSAARMRQDEKMWAAAADALAHTETRFFRDRAGFETLRKETLPQLAARRAPGARLKIWSAGCATGQEPYSIAILAEAMRQEGGPALDILATDFSERLLEKARSGLYTQFEVQRGLSVARLLAHFEKVGDLWRISDRLRASVRFENHNLLQHPSGLMQLTGGPFDLVLCCNVLSQFDPPARAAALARIADVCAPDAVLMLGEGESLPEECGFAGEAGLFTRDGDRRAA